MLICSIKKAENLILDLAESKVCSFRIRFLQRICLPTYTFASQPFLPFYAQKVFHKDSLIQKQIFTHLLLISFITSDFLHKMVDFSGEQVIRFTTSRNCALRFKIKSFIVCTACS